MRRGVNGARRRRSVACTIALLSAVLLSACRSEVTAIPPPQPVAVMPRPTVVIVDDFAADPSVVQVDSGIGGTLRRAISGVGQTQEQQKQIAAVRQSLRNSLIGEINAMNLPVRSPDIGPASPPYVEIRGRIDSIDEGNQTRRNIIGFGAGKSSVAVSTELYYVAPGAQPVLMESYDGSGNSGHMPGLAAGGAGAAAGHVALAAANTGSKIATAGEPSTDGDASKLAHDLASQIGAVFAQQGWIPASAVPSAGLR